MTDDKIVSVSMGYDGDLVLYFGNRMQHHKGVYMVEQTWKEMEEVIKSLQSTWLTDAYRLEGTEIYMQEKCYQNQLVLDIRKRRHGEGVKYHLLHHTHLGVTLKMSTVRTKLIALLPQVEAVIDELHSASETWQVVKNHILQTITHDRSRSWCDGCEIDDPSQFHHECLMLGPDLFNPLFESWSEWVMFRVMARLEDIKLDELVQKVRESSSASESSIKEAVEFLHKNVQKFAEETEEFLLKKDSYVLPGEVVTID